MVWSLIPILVLSGGQPPTAQDPAEGRQSIQPVGPVSPPFPDVPRNHWAFDAVEKVRKAGIMIGYPDGTFEGGAARNVAEIVPLDHSPRTAVRPVTADPTTPG